MKSKLRKTNGITLVALVITIIILVLLAGISISAITNQGLFIKTNQAKKENQRARVTEWLNLKLMEEQIGNPGGSAEKIITETRKNVNANIKELEKMGKEIIVEETSTEEDGEKVEIYFYVQVDEDVYKVEMTGAKFIGEAGKFPPIIKIESITDTTNSITVGVTTKRNEGGKIEYYIKKDGEEKYTLKETTTETNYTFTGLDQSQKYNIKIIAIAENEQKAEVTVDKTLGSVPEGEGKITFGETTWTEGKASTTISSIEKGYTLQYQINNTLENGWTNGESVTGLSHGDKIYARLSDGKNGGTTVEKEILDTENPYATIGLSSTNITTKEIVTATVTHKDNESGVKIENCKWIYNTIPTEIGTDENSYTGTFSNNPQKITLSTTTVGTYYLHVLTTDNAGRKKETISGVINVKETAIASAETTHTETSLIYTWDEIAEMAKLISNNSEITNDTLEVKVTLNGETKTLGVGDTTTVDGKTVRILGFNHDELTTKTAYGEETATGKAGISFEYVDFINVDGNGTTIAVMNSGSKSTNSGGWGACELRSTLNSTTYNSLSIKNKIKQVNKEFIHTYTDANSKTTSNDYLWLLSCGEIWDNGWNGEVTKGYAIATEGSQYKYYKTKLGSTAYGTNSDITKKPNVSSAVLWWLRSPFYGEDNTRFCLVSRGGFCDGGFTNYDLGIAPSFSI